MKELVSIKSLSREQILTLLERATRLKSHPPGPILQGKIMASCFFEPSTRTRLSFEAAMKRLGGEVIGFSDALQSSSQKGESLSDSMRIVGLYSDLVTLRHPLEGAARLAAEVAGKPVINAGDGANEHPSQTLLDLYTMQESQGKLDGLKIAFVGDLLYGRTVHSLIYAFKHFGPRLYFVAPPTLTLPEELCQKLKEYGVRYSFHHEIEDVIENVDILYMTRIQKERFPHLEAYERVKDHYTLTPEMLERGSPHLRVLHPLPRLQEIDPRIDSSEKAYYFQQAENGLYVREALITTLLEVPV